MACFCKCGGHLQCSRGPLEDPQGTSRKLCATLSNLNSFWGLSIPGSAQSVHTCPRSSKYPNGHSCCDMTLLPHSQGQALGAESDMLACDSPCPLASHTGSTSCPLYHSFVPNSRAALGSEACTTLNRMICTSAGFLPKPQQHLEACHFKEPYLSLPVSL